MDCIDARGGDNFVLVARRNNSLSSVGRLVVLGSLVLLSLVISVAFAWFGAWLVLPFAGVEMLVLILAFRHMDRHAGDFESLSIRGERVLIERWVMGEVSRFEFNRHWARVIYDDDQGNQTGRLRLRSHGREVEFGRHLTEEQRNAVAKTLRSELKSSY